MQKKFSGSLMTQADYLPFMQAALEEAQAARKRGEVPVGAVVVIENKIIARAHNEVEGLQDASAHAEVLAIRRASAAVRSWRLEQASLFVTLEPCTMCIGAMLLSRIKNLYFGAWDPRQGAAGSVFDLSQHPGLGSKVNVYPELMAQESANLLKSFFETCRKGKE